MSSSSVVSRRRRARCSAPPRSSRGERALVEGLGEDADEVVGGAGLARRSSMSSVHIVGVLAERPRPRRAAPGRRGRRGRRRPSWRRSTCRAGCAGRGRGPCSSAITMSGTWMAKSSTKSSSPRSAISSMIWLDSSRMWSVSGAHLRGREAPVDEAALAGVLGVVHRDDRHRRRDLRAHALGGRVELLVAADVGDVVVAGDHPELVALASQWMGSARRSQR